LLKGEDLARVWGIPSDAHVELAGREILTFAQEYHRARSADLLAIARRESEALALLRELEWTPMPELDNHWCRTCGLCKEGSGHAPDCRLAKALSDD